VNRKKQRRLNGKGQRGSNVQAYVFLHPGLCAVAKPFEKGLKRTLSNPALLDKTSIPHRFSRSLPELSAFLLRVYFCFAKNHFQIKAKDR
jgi:hypothetical protein